MSMGHVKLCVAVCLPIYACGGFKFYSWICIVKHTFALTDPIYFLFLLRTAQAAVTDIDEFKHFIIQPGKDVHGL